MVVLIFFIAILHIAVVESLNQNHNVAFTKGLDTHVLYTAGEVVKYNKDITSINSQFNAGKFVAPVDGIYSFHYYALSRSDSDIWLNFYKNEEYLTSIFAYTESSYGDAGNTMILELSVGDTVYVKAHTDYDSSLYGQVREIFNTFTGVLIVPGKSVTSNPIAFTAGLTKNITMQGGTNVIFDKIITNVGNGYDKRSGNFVAPQTGTYLVHYYSMSETNKEMFLDLYLNDRYINSVYGQASSYVDGGNSAILDLNTGDRLRVKSRPNEHNIGLFGRPDEIYSTFSGILLTSQDALPSGNLQAFSTALTRDVYSHGPQTTVIWNKVYTNHGGGFNSRTGVFTAKIAGVYVFSYHALAENTREVWLGLYHNSKYINALYGYDTVDYAGGSNTAALMLSVGDIVCVKMENKESVIYGRSDETYSMFSGYLLSSSQGGMPIIG